MKNRVTELYGAADGAAWRRTAWAAFSALTLMSGSALGQTPAPSEDTTTSPPAAQDVPEDSAAAPAAAAPAAAAPATVADQKIDQFADAYIAVQEIQVHATEQLSATTDSAKADQVKKSAEDQMIKAVERSGLQVEEFNQIVQAMATDDSLRAKVSDRIGERKRTS